MSKVVERYVGAYPSQYMWSMKRFKKRPPGEERLVLTQRQYKTKCGRGGATIPTCPSPHIFRSA